MELEEACTFINYLVDEEVENKLFIRWCAGYQFQMPFEEFKEALKPHAIKTDSEIIEETRNLFMKYT